MITKELATLDHVLLTGVHRYVFTVYALDTKLGLPPQASKKQVQKAMKGQILASGELVGRFQH